MVGSKMPQIFWDIFCRQDHSCTFRVLGPSWLRANYWIAVMYACPLLINSVISQPSSLLSEGFVTCNN